MKKILVSVAAATMALSTTASALEDIKVSGQAKLWYETSNNGTDIRTATEDKSLFDKDSSTGEVVFKLGMTGKQGDVGFGATIYQGSTMGLENNVVSGVRTNSNELTGKSDMFVGEAYITAPVAPDTLLKFGKQELDTPLAFTERWNAMPNTFNAAVAINSSVDNLTLIGAYVGQGNTVNEATFRTNDTFESYYGTAYALAALYKKDAMAANVWLYQINNVGGTGIFNNGGLTVNALWADAGMKLGDANVKGILAYLTHDGDNAEDTMAVAASADMKVADFTLFGAASYVNPKADIGVGNTATGSKKSSLPTEAVYADGLYVAQPGSMAFKLKGSTKIGDTGLALQAVYNDNTKKKTLAYNPDVLTTTEVDLFITQKLGAFDLTGILMHREIDDATEDGKVGGQYIRVIASVNF